MSSFYTRGTVNTSGGGGSSGGLTNAELRASAVPVSFGDTTQLVTGTLTTAGAVTISDLAGASQVAIYLDDLDANLAGTVIFQVTIDDTNWIDVLPYDLTSESPTGSFSTTGGTFAGYYPVAGLKGFRVKDYDGTLTGNVAVTLRATENNSIAHVDLIGTPAVSVSNATLTVKIRDAGNVNIVQQNTDPVGSEDALVVRNIPSGTQNVADGGGSLTVDGSVAVSNFPATQPVSGTVTANAGTGPWPVTDNGGSITVDDGAGSLTVDGTVTANQGTAPWQNGLYRWSTLTGSITGTGQSVDFTIPAEAQLAIFWWNGSGISLGSISFSGSTNGSTFLQIETVKRSDQNSTTSTITSSNLTSENSAQVSYYIPVAGFSTLRISSTGTWSSANITLNVTFTSGVGRGHVVNIAALPAVQQGATTVGASQSWVTRICDTTNTAAVKAASTAAVAADPALVVAVSPNNTIPVSAASLPLPSGAATEVTLAAVQALLNIAQGASSIALTGQLVQAVVSDTPQSYTTDTVQPLSVTAEGRLRVSTVSADINRIWQSTFSSPWADEWPGFSNYPFVGESK